MYQIYKITNLLNNKTYIGKTNNCDRRWKDHKRLAFTPDQKEYNKVLYKAFRKYGLENFIFEIVEITDAEHCNERESYWIKYYDSYTNGYNETCGGDGGSLKGRCLGSNNGRAKLTEEDVKNIRLAYKEGKTRKEVFELYKDKISDSGFGRVWQGKTWTHILPEVYTEQNKQKTIKNGRGQSAKHQRLYTDEEVRYIRLQKSLGRSLNDVFNECKKTSSIDTFKDIWYNKTYKEISI